MPRRIFRVIVIRLKFDAIKECMATELTHISFEAFDVQNEHAYVLALISKGAKALKTKGREAY